MPWKWKIHMIHSWIKNEVKWIFAKLEENASVQTNAFSERNKKNLKKMKKKLHGQKLFWNSSSRNALCWAFYYVTNNEQVDLTPPQAMHCIFLITIQFWI